MLLEEQGIIVISRSSLYETESVGSESSNYLNAVVEVETSMSPTELMHVCLMVETRLGRIRGFGEVRWGARTMDIDILIYGNDVCGWSLHANGMYVAEDTLKTLVVPHPRMHERNFVLVPFVELLANHGEVLHPIFHKTIFHLLAESSDTHRVALADHQW